MLQVPNATLPCSPSFQPIASRGSSGCHASFTHSVERTFRMSASLLGSRGRPCMHLSNVSTVCTAAYCCAHDVQIHVMCLHVSRVCREDTLRPANVHVSMCARSVPLKRHPSRTSVRAARSCTSKRRCAWPAHEGACMTLCMLCMQAVYLLCINSHSIGAEPNC